MDSLGRSILATLSEVATLAGSSQNEPLAEATANVMAAMLNEGLIGPKEDWVYQTIMHQMFRSGVFHPTLRASDPTAHELQWYN